MNVDDSAASSPAQTEPQNSPTKENNAANISNREENSENYEYDDFDSSPVFQEIIGQFQVTADQLDVEMIQLDLRNAQAMKTLLCLMLASSKKKNLKNKNTQDDTIKNFLTYIVHDLQNLDDFDIKYELAQMFQEFIPELYSKKTSLLLIDLCEQFLEPDEALIKDEAFKLTAILLEYLDGDDIAEFLKVVYKLYENDWKRCTGIDLMALCFHKLPEMTQKEFRVQFMELMHDESTLSKSAMARNYGKIVQHYQKEWIETEAIDTLQQLVEDIQITVRIHAVETAITIASLIEEDLIDKHLSAIFEKLSQDNSWKVRLEVATRIVDIQKAVKPKMARILLITLLQTLCTDRETIVRRQLAENIIDVVITFKETTDIDLTDIFEVINELNKDCNDEVQTSLMYVMMDCASVLTKNECKTHLLPMMKNTLMCQTITGLQKVPEQCVLNINKLISVLGYEAMQEELEKFMFGVLSADSQWRTRRRLVMTLNILALNASEEYFTKVCLSFYKKMLNDSCHAVRRLVPMILPGLIGRFGIQWGMKNILSYIFSFYDHPTSFQRLLVLYTIEELVQPSLLNISGSKYIKKSHLASSMTKDYLYKVFSLNEMLKYKLDQLEVVADEDDDHDDTGHKSSDLIFYGEDMAEDFAEFDVPLEDTMDLLTFIIKHIIPIIANSLNDKVINVINRSIHTYKIILRLHREINKEFQQDLFKDVLDTFNKESRKSIESNILHQLTEIDGHMEEKIEHPVRGQDFEPGTRFEDALETSLDGDIDTGHQMLSTEDVLRAFDEFELETPKFLDGNDNFDEDKEDFAEDDDEKSDKKMGENNNTSETSEKSGKSSNATKNSPKNDSNDNEVDKHLLDDVDMNLFDRKKTVLEFYSDVNSDAIDI